ncbi:Flp family type IVb pilin [Photobacterium leiognathi]|uniref:Flp family type IVb pilin n=1 Tax=Photobacterium leiognathi TaxID=553611 RepID=UPI002736CBA8|nr:Flp family type IVb pilin [Photobacterium leiognathi]
MNEMRAFFAKFQKDERGVTAIEYGLIAIAMTVAISLIFSGNGDFIKSLKGSYANVGKALSTASSAAVSTAEEIKTK